MVARFHERGVKVLWPNFPWDQGTRNEGRPQYEALIDLLVATDSDGVNGDTHDCLNNTWWEYALSTGRGGFDFEPQSMGNRRGTDHTGWQSIVNNVNSWSSGWRQSFAPLVSAYKLIEPRHLVHQCNRHEVNKTNDIQTAYFNGGGYESWESIWGMFNQITPYHGEALRRVATILREFGDLTSGQSFSPHVPVTTQHGVYASRFGPSAASSDYARTLYTIINRNAHALSGKQLTLDCSPDSRFFDVYHGRQLHTECSQGVAALQFKLEPLGYGGVLHVQGSPTAMVELEDRLTTFLEQMKAITRRPLSSFSDEWLPLLQVQHSDPPTPVPTVAPAGMRLVPGGSYEFVAKGESEIASIARTCF